MTNRPLRQEDSLWPADPRLHIVSGVDLLKGTQEELEQALKSKVKGIEDVTHVYYLGKHSSLFVIVPIEAEKCQPTRHRKTCSRS